MRTITIKLKIPDFLGYQDIKFFLKKMIFNDSNKVTGLTEFSETEIEEYHERQALNKDVKWIPGQPYWKNRKHTQTTKDKISQTLRAKFWRLKNAIN